MTDFEPYSKLVNEQVTYMYNMELAVEEKILDFFT